MGEWLAWLIERESSDGGPQPEYWAGTTRWGLAVREDWTIDPFRARHFPTKADAEAVVTEKGDRLGAAEVVEHGFTGTPQRPDPASIEEIAAGIEEIGTGGTPAFIRGYNRGYDDAYEHALEAANRDRQAAEEALRRVIRANENYSPLYDDDVRAADELNDALDAARSVLRETTPGETE
jgi:hypothetical protein